MTQQTSMAFKLNIYGSASLAVVIIIEFLLKNFMMGFYAFSCILCFNILFILMKIVKRDLEGWKIILCYIFMVVAIYFSNRFDLYHRFWYFDIVLHSFSGVILAIIMPVLFMRNETRKIMTPLEYGFICFIFALASAGLWEIMEFFFDLISGSDVQRNLQSEKEIFFSTWQNPGILDTMNDIINGTIGGVLGAILVWIDQKRKANATKRDA